MRTIEEIRKRYNAVKDVEDATDSKDGISIITEDQIMEVKFIADSTEEQDEAYRTFLKCARYDMGYLLKMYDKLQFRADTLVGVINCLVGVYADVISEQRADLTMYQMLDDLEENQTDESPAPTIGEK